MKKICFISGLFLMASLSSAQVPQTTKEGYVFTKTKDQLKEYINILSIESYNTANDHLAKLKLKNQGGIFKDETLVQVQDNFNDLIKIKIHGSSDTYWTKKEALKTNKKVD